MGYAAGTTGLPVRVSEALDLRSRRFEEIAWVWGKSREFKGNRVGSTETWAAREIRGPREEANLPSVDTRHVIYRRPWATGIGPPPVPRKCVGLYRNPRGPIRVGFWRGLPENPRVYHVGPHRKIVGPEVRGPPPSVGPQPGRPHRIRVGPTRLPGKSRELEVRGAKSH